MDTLVDALRNAVQLVITLDSNVVEYAVRSLAIAAISTLVASVIGIPIGILIGENNFPGKRGVVTILNTLLALPTVVVGLMVYTLISRTGPLGRLELLFTIPGIIVGEVVLILPILTAFTVAAVSRTDRDVRKTALALGASTRQAHWIVIREARFGVLAAVIAAFARVVSEVGVATILGGNIDRFTRTMTTAIVRHVDMGDFALAMALGIVLLGISLSVNVLFQYFQGGVHE